MKLVIEIQMDNAAFENDNEIGRIVQEYGQKLVNNPLYVKPGASYPFFDINGNFVGSASFVKT